MKIRDNTVGGIRTHRFTVLSRLPLPFGYNGKIYKKTAYLLQISGVETLNHNNQGLLFSDHRVTRSRSTYLQTCIKIFSAPKQRNNVFLYMQIA